MINYVEKARTMGFHAAEVMKVKDLTVVPEYRKYCEENLCGKYNVLKACPPESGTVDEMQSRMEAYDEALILQTVVESGTLDEDSKPVIAKKHHNELTEMLLAEMEKESGRKLLMMGAGPWKEHSCMSAYCVDAQKMADAVGMKCWENDGMDRYFSLILF